jgi:hypothetical protein
MHLSLYLEHLDSQPVPLPYPFPDRHCPWGFHFLYATRFSDQNEFLNVTPAIFCQKTLENITLKFVHWFVQAESKLHNRLFVRDVEIDSETTLAGDLGLREIVTEKLSCHSAELGDEFICRSVTSTGSLDLKEGRCPIGELLGQDDQTCSLLSDIELLHSSNGPLIIAWADSCVTKSPMAR